MVVSTCLDHRIRLRIPENFAYVLRTGGANLPFSEFEVSFAIAIGHVSSMVIIGHSNCGMVNLESKKELFVQRLVQNAGCDRWRAEDLFGLSTEHFEIENEVDFVLKEAARLRLQYPKTKIAPLIYRAEDNKLYLIKE